MRLKIYEKLSEIRKTTIWQDVTICVTVSLTCAFYEFERFFPAFATDTIKAALLALFVICWLWCAFLNGFWRRYRFLAFAALYWTVPRLIILKETGTGILDYNKYLDAASQYSRLLVQFSLLGLSNLLNTSDVYLSAVLLAFCLCLFFAGKRLRAAGYGNIEQENINKESINKMSIEQEN